MTPVVIAVKAFLEGAMIAVTIYNTIKSKEPKD